MSANYVGERRFPVAALLVASGAASVTELAKDCQMTRRQMCRYVAAGVPESRADAIAVRLGLHPGEVWAEWFEGAA